MPFDDNYVNDFEPDPHKKIKKMLFIVIVITLAFFAEYTLMQNLL